MKTLDHINRMRWEGFLEYFRQRPHHFVDVFGCSFTELTAKEAYKEVKYLVQQLLRGNSKMFLE